MKLKAINIKNASYNFPVILMCIYTFTRGGAALLLSNGIWAAVLGVVFLFSICHLFKRSNANYTIESLMVMLMICVMVLWNNQDFKHGVWFLDYIMVVFFVFLLSAMKSDCWVNTAFRMMLIMSLFHTAWTLICFLFPSVFFNVVYPIVQPITLYDLRAMFNKGFMMGFNYSNSQNAIYLSMGIMVLISSFIIHPKNKDPKIRNVIYLILTFVSLLLAGKRGPILWLLLSFILTYYVFNCDKKLSRWFKILGIVGVLIVLLYFGSFFIPQLMNFIYRFSEQIEAGDISTHRFELWESGWKAFLAEPIIGNGWFWFKYNNTFGTNYHVHNCFLQWLCELGIIGSIPFFSFTIITYLRTIKLIKMVKLNGININDLKMRNLVFALLYQTYFIIYGFAGTAFYEPETLLPWIFSSAIVIYEWHNIDRSSKKKFLRGL